MACHLQIDPDPDPVNRFDPDPAFHVDADPDTTFQFGADPDPQNWLPYGTSFIFLLWCLALI